MNDTQLATAVDCEGYIGIYRSHDKRRNRYGYCPRISVGMTHPAIPEEFRRRFGSNIYISKSRREYKTCYSWVVQNRDDVQAILTTLLPHLLVKDESAKNVLEFIAYCQEHSPTITHGGVFQRRRTTDDAVLESYWLKAKELNQREPATTKRRDPVTGSNSLNLQETVREEFEAISPVRNDE